MLGARNERPPLLRAVAYEQLCAAEAELAATTAPDAGAAWKRAHLRTRIVALRNLLLHDTALPHRERTQGQRLDQCSLWALE